MNDQFSEAYEINAGVSQGPLLDSIFILLNNNGLGYIFRPLVKISADDFTVYWCTSKSQNDRRLDQLL